jgi:hypothetical protein
MADESLPHDGLDEIDPALVWPARLYVNEKGIRVLETRGIYASGTSKDPDSIRGLVQLRKAGRYTLGEIAVGLEEKTGVSAKRWFETIEEAVISGKLKLKNYYNLADTLPYQASSLSYRPGKVWDYEHVLADDINQWLDSHPEYGASFRFDIVSQSVEIAKAEQPATGRRAQQISAILAAIDRLGFEPKAIPSGGRARIKRECMKDAALFTPAGFDHAWKARKKL